MNIMKQIIRFTDQHTVMSDREDLLIETRIFKHFKPKNVYELGAATGNWCAAMNEFSSIDSHFTLVENFDVLKNFPTLDIPFNETQLKENLSQFNINYDLIIDSVDNLKSTEEPIDLVRLDCDPLDYNKLIRWIFDNASDNLIVLSDDIMPNRCPQRFMAFQEQVAKGNLKLIWVGIDTAAWVLPSTQVDKFYELVLKELSDYYDVLEFCNPYTFFDIPQKHLVSRFGTPYKKFL